MKVTASILFSFVFLPFFGMAGTLKLEIRHLWEGEPVEVPSRSLVTAGGETISVKRLTYLLSEPGLVSKTKNSLLSQEKWFGLVDAQNDTGELILEGVPEDSYEMLRLHIGLSESVDQSDPNQFPPYHALNPLRNNLHWSPQGGYIFLALEGHADEDRGYSYHLGNSKNRVVCDIPITLEMGETATVCLDFHLDRFFNMGDPLLTLEQSSTHSREGDPLALRMKEQFAHSFTVSEIKYLDEKVEEVAPEASKQTDLVGTPYPFKLRKGFPIPALPLDFPLTNERVALGERLFHETLLSRDATVSCSTCHQSASAFSDSRQFSLGIDGQQGKRNSMPLVNLAWKDSFFWDGRAQSLREQVLMPIEDHLEMDASIETVVEKLSADSTYKTEFETAFGEGGINGERIAIALEQFLLSLTSYDSKFDRAALGKDELTVEETRGLELFMTEFDPRRGLHGADCFHCHGGAFFTQHSFHNNGLESFGDRGLEEVTGKESDRGKFITPSLRNIALTAPYMHDGRFQSLEEVVAHYASGVERSPTLDPNIAKHPVGGLPLTEEDQSALVAFLKTLTDERFTPSNL